MALFGWFWFGQQMVARLVGKATEVDGGHGYGCEGQDDDGG